jgi:hypothetical protein
MPTKERNNDLQEITPFSDEVLKEMLPVVVVPLVLEDPSHPEEALELLEADDATSTLRHDKPMEHLIPG